MRTMSGFLPFKIILWILLSVASLSHAQNNPLSSKQIVKSLYIPLADHYAAIVAYERYAKDMKYADFQLEQMKSWDLLRSYFQSGEVDMAFVMSPLAMDMYIKKPDFKWIGLLHRDGNALAINDVLNKQVGLSPLRKDRKPGKKIAAALKKIHKNSSRSTEIAMPHLLSTHSVVLYRYLKEHGIEMSLRPDDTKEVLAIAVAPSKSPVFLKSKSARAQAAAFEQSLPWADIVETGGFGHVAWYSKDVMPWKDGHVECIAIATDIALKTKFKAVLEVKMFIQKAGQDIEVARKEGGEKLEAIVEIVRKHIPAHTREAIVASLDPELRVINYENLDIDVGGLKQIMDYAIEAGIISEAIDIEVFADHRFDYETNKH